MIFSWIIRHGINRYIMECKCDFVIRNLCLFAELIDTLWNVNRNKRGEIMEGYEN